MKNSILQKKKHLSQTKAHRIYTVYIIAIKLFTSSSRSQKAELNTKKFNSETGDFPDIFSSLIKTKHVFIHIM